MEKGYVQVYTGNGKGKTTAAIGLCIRALGAGKKVFIGQFFKGMPYSEHRSMEKIGGITIRQYGGPCFIKNGPSAGDIDMARKGLDEMREVLASGEYDIVVLDEACLALHYGVFVFDEFLNAINNRAPHVEAVITGRYAPAELIREADLVTEMNEIKHYYRAGISARTGIEK